MNLYADIGNSRIKLQFADADTSPVAALDYDRAVLPDILDNFCKAYPAPDRIVVANVAGNEVAGIFTEICKTVWSGLPEYLSVKSECYGLIQGYRDRNQLGIDRWLAMLAAWHKYKSELYVVDCGSAVTVDMISATGRHQGGYIMPGSQLMQQVLAAKTGGIRIPDIDNFSERPGVSTAECVVNGTVIAVSAFIERVTRHAGVPGEAQPRCVITGGGAEVIMNLMSISCTHEPHLVMDGIRLAAEC